MVKAAWIYLAVALVGPMLSGCNGADAGSALSSGNDATSRLPSPSGGNLIGQSCSGSGMTCLALKYVVYNDGSGEPVVTSSEAIGNVQSINQTWSQCGIAFQVDEFLAVAPSTYGLAFNTANLSDLDTIRRTFDDTSTLLVVTTGQWNRSGTLGNTGANAWTNMPGSSVLGAVLEAGVGTYSNIIAHELGHYLSLGHMSDSTDLMNPVIYSNSTKLTSTQCSAAKRASASYWSAMQR